MRAPEPIRTAIWDEVPETDNPFAAAVCRCRGYDVYGELLHHASYIEYLYLLLAGERPAPARARLLERMAIALANPGPRDASVHAAMCAGVGGSPAAAALMAALGVGAGNLGGAREVRVCIAAWQRLGLDLGAWSVWLKAPEQEVRADIWPPFEHIPGFDPHGASCPTPLRQILEVLAHTGAGPHLPWLMAQRSTLEAAAGMPLALSGIAAAACMDLGLGDEQGELLYLLLRLPGAGVHALEQRAQGWRRFPYFGSAVELTNDPGPPAVPA